VAIVAEALETVTVWQCQECEAIVTAEDLADTGPLYECGECAEIFTRDNSADGMGNRCPECHHFATKIADRACVECEAGGLQEIQAVEVDGEWIPADDYQPTALVAAR
jgi:hypothetical protein